MKFFQKIYAFFQSILHKFGSLSIYKKLLFIIAFVFFAIAALSYFNFRGYKSDKEASIKQNILQTNHQASETIDNYLTDIDKISIFPLTHKQNDVSYMTELMTFNTAGKSTLAFQNLNEEMFNDILTYKPALNSCYIFNIAGAADYKVEIPIYNAFNPVHEDWFAETINLFGKANIVDTYILPNTTDDKRHYVFGIARGIVKIETAQVIGVLLVNTDIAYLREICNDMKLSDNNRIIILHDENIIYDTVEANIGTTTDIYPTSLNLSEFPAQSAVETTMIDNQRVYVSSQLSDYSNWRIVSIIPTADLYTDINQMQVSTVLITLIILLVTACFILLISRQIVLPIRKLQVLMKLAETGQFDQQIKVTTQDEIGSLATSFNHMTQKINTLIDEVYLTEIKRGQLELQMLQSQINPHFLYNTLESISMMATINDDDTTAEMASDLGQILYYGISKNKNEVTIDEEIAVLDRYIHLQEIRFHDSYHIKIELPNDIREFYIIKLILQPIVENAIYHGMSTRRKDGLISVTGALNGNLIQFYVTDNGTGMDTDTLDALNGYINDENNRFKSIGLRNVNKRIKVRYGNTYGLHIESTPAIGTKVTVTIPVIREPMESNISN